MLAITGGIVFLPIVMDRWDDPVGIDVSMHNDTFLNLFGFNQNSKPVGMLQESTPVPNRPFDFIVVGAGAAGPAVAARLSEDPHVSVLLLEAGGDGNLLSTIPAGIPFLFDVYETGVPFPLGENPLDWGYKGGGFRGWCSMQKI